MKGKKEHVSLIYSSDRSYHRRSMEVVLALVGEIREDFPQGETLELNFFFN